MENGEEWWLLNGYLLKIVHSKNSKRLTLWWSIDIVNNNNIRDGLRKPVFNSRDTQEVPLNEACIMMEKIEKYLNTNTILEHFEYYDMRQENYEKSNPQLNQISNI